MALERKDRVKDQSATTGTGTLTIDGIAPTGYRTITSAHTDGATVRYTILLSDLTEWEVGEGVWTTSGGTLTRVTVFASSNANALVTFSAGDKIVFTGPVADDVSFASSTAIPTDGWYRTASNLMRSPNDVTLDGDLILNATKRLYLDGIAGVGGNSYIRETSADLVSLYTANSERIRFDPTGNIGFNWTGGLGGGSGAMRVNSAVTGAVASAGGIFGWQIKSDVTTSCSCFQSSPYTEVAAFTLANLYHFVASLVNVGAGSTITNQYGFNAGTGLTGATNNYGFYGALAVSGTARWNLYMSGTALNYLGGDTSILATKKLALDGVGGTGGGDTYLIETSANVLDLFAGGTKTLSLSTAGAAVTGTISGTSSILSSSASGGVGYATGAGGVQTQGTSRVTGVTLSTVSGAITLFSEAGSATPQTFTVTNTAVAATDTISLSQKSGTDLYHLLVTAVAAGSFNITVFTTGGTTTEAPVINFNVIKGVAA